MGSDKDGFLCYHAIVIAWKFAPNFGAPPKQFGERKDTLMRMRRLCSCMMALLLAVSLPLTVFAETYDLENGSIIVSSNESGQYVT